MSTQSTPHVINRLKWPSMNPILMKELRSRMRGRRAFAILTGFLLLLSLVCIFFYLTIRQNPSFGRNAISLSAMIGVSMFQAIALFELFLVAFITPALTAGAVSGEREGLTYEMLIATPLRPTSILIGKMLAALSYVFLLIFSAIPMFSLVYLFGGVTWQDMLIALLLLLLTTITFGTIGIFWSTVLGRTSRATVMSYLTIIGLIVGPIMASVVWGMIYQQIPPPGFSYLNPFRAMLSVISAGTEPSLSFGPFYFLFGMLSGDFSFGNSFGPLNHPAWHWTMAAYTLITLLLAILTIFFIRPIGRRRPTLPQVLLTALLIFSLLGSMSLIFSPNDWKEIWFSPEGPRFIN